MNEYNLWRGAWLSIRDSPEWKTKYPQGPVHFDVRCNRHKVEYLDISPTSLPSGPLDFIALLRCCWPDVNK